MRWILMAKKCFGRDEEVGRYATYEEAIKALNAKQPYYVGKHYGKIWLVEIGA